MTCSWAAADYRLSASVVCASSRDCSTADTLTANVSLQQHTEMVGRRNADLIPPTPQHVLHFIWALSYGLLFNPDSKQASSAASAPGAAVRSSQAPADEPGSSLLLVFLEWVKESAERTLIEMHSNMDFKADITMWLDY